MPDWERFGELLSMVASDGEVEGFGCFGPFLQKLQQSSLTSFLSIQCIQLSTKDISPAGARLGCFGLKFNITVYIYIYM